jgi:formylglycine-generating enzyme required for sulfatase activity
MLDRPYLDRHALDRAALRARYLANRAGTKRLFELIAPQAYYDRPIPLRLPLVFYEGHIPAFSFNTLPRKALGAALIHGDFETLFERGIDPASETEARSKGAHPWPERSEVRKFARACDEAVLGALASPGLETSESPLLERSEAVFTILEHEEMHQETLLYLIHQLGGERKNVTGRLRVSESPPVASGRAPVGAGPAWLGADRDRSAFGWDNEFGRHAIPVDAFEIDINNVTNGDYLAFVEAGGPIPPFWLRRDGAWRLRTLLDEVALPLTWPVYATHAQATAYAGFRGARLPTEAEYDRAAYGTPDGSERRYPWGDAEPTAEHANLGLHRYDPESVGIRPRGASAWGVHDLAGNGWEWTATPFAPFAGFAPMASYPQYSADFFDGEHFVCKGASPVTATALLRRSFRNWYRAEYPYLYATFRCVWS